MNLKASKLLLLECPQFSTFSSPDGATRSIVASTPAYLVALFRLTCCFGEGVDCSKMADKKRSDEQSNAPRTPRRGRHSVTPTRHYDLRSPTGEPIVKIRIIKTDGLLSSYLPIFILQLFDFYFRRRVGLRGTERRRRTHFYVYPKAPILYSARWSVHTAQL